MGAARTLGRSRMPVPDFWTAFFGTLAFLWLAGAVRAFAGAARMPQLSSARLAADADCPVISILFGARDEAAGVRDAVASMLAQDYPRFEVVAVDDRSTDDTPRILDEAAARDARLRVVHLTELPPGWLGKPHALQIAYEHSSSDWLLFTDADIRFTPDVLRGAIAMAQDHRLDHLTLLPRLDMHGFGEKMSLTYWALGFLFNFEPWRVIDQRSSRYMGAGAFQLIRRSAYEALGTHRRLAMEVVDDIKLGKLVKTSGFRSGVGVAEEMLRVRWQEGLGNIIRGLEKNAFAAMGYSVAQVFAGIVLMLLLDVLPFAAIPFTSGSARLAAAGAALVAVLSQAVIATGSRVSPLYGLTHPLGALVMIWTVMRSAAITLRNGGITWRGTFYPLRELRRGVV
jgi:hypothetical protein